MGRREEIIHKIMSRVLIDPSLTFDGEPCWIWQGSCSGNGRGGGYPRMSLDGQTVAVHRVMFVCENGYVPGKKHIDHKCRNRMCVNPAHLRMATHKQNCRYRDLANNLKETTAIERIAA